MTEKVRVKVSNDPHEIKKDRCHRIDIRSRVKLYQQVLRRKKLKTGSVEVPVNAAYGYHLITFLSFISTLSEMVKCKKCNGNLTFSELSICGLGFKLVINCNNCEPRYINSCPLMKDSYEINKRVVFAMRILGVSYDGMHSEVLWHNRPPENVQQKVYYNVISCVICTSKVVANSLSSEAAAEEKELTKNAENVAEPTKRVFSGTKTVEIASCLAASIFNEGYESLLKMIHIMNQVEIWYTY